MESQITTMLDARLSALAPEPAAPVASTSALEGQVLFHDNEANSWAQRDMDVMDERVVQEVLAKEIEARWNQPVERMMVDVVMRDGEKDMATGNVAKVLKEIGIKKRDKVENPEKVVQSDQVLAGVTDLVTNIDNFDFSVGSPLDPPPDMTFCSVELLKEFAQKWAKTHGYAVFIKSSKAGQNVYLACD